MSTKNSGSLNFRGTRDWFGDEMRWRKSIVSTIENVFESFGFEPLETPILETMKTLTGKYGEEGEMKLFRLTGNGTDIRRGGLRYDHTVPLARAVALNWNRLIMPYRRYAIGPVFRNESTQAGRFRQFYQCDFDTIGSDSLLVDAEISTMNYRVLTALGFPVGSFQILVNDRRLLNALARYIKADDNQMVEIFRAWDKLEKVDRESVRKELLDKGLSFRLVSAFDRLTDVLQNATELSATDSLAKISSAMNTPEVTSAVRVVDDLFSYISASGVPPWAVRFYPLLARGLDYYTGPIFETSAGELGSITGGGRFDQLIGQLGGPDLPASGSSFGLERLMVVLEELELKPEFVKPADVFVTVFDQQNPQLIRSSFELASSLRQAGFRVEVYTGSNARLGKQLDICRRKNIPVALIVGEEEISSGNVAVKNMVSSRSGGNQSIIPKKELETFVAGLLG